MTDDELHEIVNGPINDWTHERKLASELLSLRAKVRAMFDANDSRELVIDIDCASDEEWEASDAADKAWFDAWDELRKAVGDE